MSWPEQGKHMAFDGRHLHAVFPSLTRAAERNHLAEEGENRVTFLVNIWLGHRPLRCATLSADKLSKMSNLPDTAEVFDPQVMKFHPAEGMSVADEGSVEVLEFEVDQFETPHLLQLPLPSDDACKANASDGKQDHGPSSNHVRTLTFSGKSRCRLGPASKKRKLGHVAQ